MMVKIPFARKRNLKELKESTLFNKTIQVTSKVKYTGLTLDKGLLQHIKDSELSEPATLQGPSIQH
jgi:hypothetical protein